MNGSTHIDGDGLSPAAKAALAALRAEEEVPGEALARGWSRLDAATATEDVAERTGRRRATIVVLGLALAAGVVLAVAGLRGAAGPVARDTTAPAAQYGGEAGATQVARVGAGKAGAARGAAVAEEPAAADPAAEEPVAAAARSGRTTGPSGQVAEDRSRGPGRRRGDEASAAAPADRGGPGPALAREATLLQQAQAALAGARPAEALARLADYDREFTAGGVLRTEHDALRVEALCAAGRVDEGEAAAAAFLRAHAGSVHADRVRGACAARP